MIIGAHMMIQTRNEAADRRFFTDVLKLPSVDAGDGFLIFAVPAGELAAHESDKNDVHEIYLMCDDIASFVADMKRQKIACTEPENQGWGTLTRLTLPGGGRLGVYQPHHARPKARA